MGDMPHPHQKYVQQELEHEQVGIASCWEGVGSCNTDNRIAWSNNEKHSKLVLFLWQEDKYVRRWSFLKTPAATVTALTSRHL